MCALPLVDLHGQARGGGDERAEIAVHGHNLLYEYELVHVRECTCTCKIKLRLV